MVCWGRGIHIRGERILAKQDDRGELGAHSCEQRVTRSSGTCTLVDTSCSYQFTVVFSMKEPANLLESPFIELLSAAS